MRHPQHFQTCPNMEYSGYTQGRYPGLQVLIYRLPISTLNINSSQWHIGKSALTYRCGGSTGIGICYSTPVSRLTCLQTDKHLKAAQTLTYSRIKKFAKAIGYQDISYN